MSAKGVVLVSSSALSVGTVTTTPVMWSGGRGCLVVNAAVYGIGTQFQMQGPGGGWIQVNSGATLVIGADCFFPFDLPAGQLRMALAGSTSGMSAVFVGVTYT